MACKGVFSHVLVEDEIVAEELDIVVHPEADGAIEERRENQDVYSLPVQGSIKHGGLSVGKDKA